ncbi:MAG: mCpol domain-containing protein [Candidatus Entotheonellia bacterium]
MTTMTSALYILGDVDRVRESIERHLLAGRLDALKQFSDTLTAAVGVLAQRIHQTFSADIIMAGGDDVLFYVPHDRFSKTDLATIAQQFASESGCTISFGVAADITTAYVNLRRAKSSGGNAIIGSGAIP